MKRQDRKRRKKEMVGAKEGWEGKGLGKGEIEKA